MEIWKDIPGYEGSYQASNEGRIRSLNRTLQDLWRTRRVKGKMIKQFDNGRGYFRVRVSGKTISVHRIVIRTFIGKSDFEVNHKNGIKADNRIENLEYCTRKENIRHAFDLGLNRGRRGTENWKHKRIIQFDIHGTFIRDWDCLTDASKGLNTSISNISSNLHGKQKTAGGFIFKFKHQ